MKIGIDARLFTSQTGIGRYTRSLFFEYAANPAFMQDQFALFDDQPYSPSRGQNAQGVPDPLPAHVEVVIARCKRRILWTNWHLPPLLRRHQIDVYHGVCNFELPLRKMCRYVVTIHDLVPLFFPELVPKKHLLFFRLFMRRAAHTADCVITDSIHSKQDIIRYLQVPENKIRVIYLGYEARYHEVRDEQLIQTCLSRYGIRAPYLLFVGVIEPKKNLERLVDAFVFLQKHCAAAKDLQLVLAGGEGWFSDRLHQQVRDLHLDKQVVFPGFIADADLPALYSGAELFVFPSIYEGFGLPVLEAMSCGTPVVTSNVSSLPEIAGEAGVLVDPTQPTSIAEGIASVLEDPQRQAEMKTAGYQQARKFSWKRTAEQTYQVYQEVCQ